MIRPDYYEQVAIETQKADLIRGRLKSELSTEDKIDIIFEHIIKHSTNSEIFRLNKRYLQEDKLND